MGGVPLCAVFDRPKTVALQWKKNGEVTEWNPIFAYAALEIGFTAEVCWPYQPQQKGSVESIVKWVKGSFFTQRRFHDQDDLLTQFLEVLHHLLCIAAYGIGQIEACQPGAAATKVHSCHPGWHLVLYR